jgi:hypothetical protein
MDEFYFEEETGLGYHLLKEDVILQEYNFAQDNIDEVVSYWSEYTTTSFDLSAFPVAVATVGNRITLPNMFHRVTSSDFKLGSTEAIGLTSTFDLGLPIHGYASSSQNVMDQYADVGAWLWEEFDSYLKNAGFEGVDVYFDDTEGAMRDTEVGMLAIESFGLLPASIVFVLAYLVFSKHEIVLMFCLHRLCPSFITNAVQRIYILSARFFLHWIGWSYANSALFIPSIIIYRYIFQIEYLGVLNLIAIYIIVSFFLAA